MTESNNVIQLAKHPKFKQAREVSTPIVPLSGSGGIDDIPFGDNWAWLHKAEYEEKVQMLVDEGMIKSGRVEMNDFGIPTIYVTLYDDYDQTVEATLDPDIKPGANNT